MIFLTHPTGNSFVRALLQGFEEAELDYLYYTTFVFDEARWWSGLLPQDLRIELKRRSYRIPASRCRQRPVRELNRLLLSRLAGGRWSAHGSGPFSVDAVYQDLDRHAASQLRHHSRRESVQAVYAYEDGARETFAAARSLGAKRYYELPIAYWETTRRLLREEAERWPAWEPTLAGTRDSAAKLERKTEELELADAVICPSRFVLASLPASVRAQKECIVAEFGSPEPPEYSRREVELSDRPLRVLFVGSMSQRKGLADLFKAMQFLNRPDVELIVMGSPLLPMAFYRRQYAAFKYEPPRPHHDVLALMQQCDLLALPSIVEGRALVQQEALSCGLPILVTSHAGGEDLVDPGKTGFIVPIRAPERIAEKLAWFAEHRDALPEMRRLSRQIALHCTWRSYRRKILNVLPQAAAWTGAAA